MRSLKMNVNEFGAELVSLHEEFVRKGGAPWRDADLASHFLDGLLPEFKHIREQIYDEDTPSSDLTLKGVKKRVAEFALRHISTT